MEIVKKNVVSIVCGVIALLAVASFFYPTPAIQASAQKSLDQQAETYKQLTSLQGKTRHWPNVTQDPNATPQELKGFPGPKVIESGMAQVKQVQDQSLALKDRAIKMNVHQLLVPDSLPNPPNAFDFRNAYDKRYQFDEKATQGSFQKMLNSVTPPTAEEISREEQRREAKIKADAPHDAENKPFDEAQVNQQIEDMKSKIEGQMRQDAALQHKLYMAPEALPKHPSLAGEAGAIKAPEPEDVWYAQMGLWIQEDVIKSIAALNAQSNDVEHSPVKQIVMIMAAPPDKSMYALSTTAAAGAESSGGNASPIPTNSDADALPKDYTSSPTGRVCNGVFDVVHFKVVLNVQAADIDRVISELERDKFLTVYQASVQAINSVAKRQEGYYFGSRPVVTLSLDCEELFMRDWTKKLMPQTVKQYLNVQEAQQQATDQSGATSSQ